MSQLRIPRLAALAVPFLAAHISFGAQPIRLLLIDGQNNHGWQQTTPVLKSQLEETKMFQVDVVTTPPKGGDMSQFKPDFSKYRAIVMNYTGDAWSAGTNKAFEAYVKNGGGLVIFHAADNAFPEWPEFNLMIGVGGWNGRDEKSGPHWYFKDGKLFGDTSPGRAGSHGARLPFQLITRDANHPIMKGLPEKWMHDADELYARMRGPGKNMTLLATAYSDPANKGTGQHEPMLLALSYGKGRIFHTMLGHDPKAMASVGFIVTLQRGTEWAATGKVTQKVPPDFPTADKVSVRAAR